VSLTSCYRYILELPVNTLNAMMRAAFAESGPAGVLISRPWEDVPIGDKTADITVRPDDLEANPPVLTLSATDLECSLHLRMRAEITIQELPDLDKIIYILEFDLPGVFVKDAEVPPRLLMQFPGVTAGDLNLAVTGGEIILTPELVEPRIHEIYDSDPTLAHEQRNNQPWWDGSQVQIITDFYDDEPGSMPFRGAITVEVPNANSIVIVMPGHMKVQGISGPPKIDNNITLRVTVATVLDQVAGELRVRLSNVQQGDIAVSGLTGSVADVLAAETGLKIFGADKINNFPDHVESIPTEAEVRGLIETQLIDLSADLSVPIFTPAMPGAGEIDLTTFEPTTVAQQALALQLVPRADGTPCDAPDLFCLADGFSVAIAAVEVNALMQPILDNNEGDHHLQGYDMTVNNLSGTLSDPNTHSQPEGHIWINGDVDVHVDCWSDPNVVFSGPVFLDPSMNVDGELVFTADAGGFTADDPCCGDVDPADIEELIEGEESTPVKLPTDFTNVGRISMTVTEALISAAGIVVHGTLTVTTTSAASSSKKKKMAYWFSEMAGGG
jgi:hypothetical protein